MKFKSLYIIIAPVFFSILPVLSLFNQNRGYYEPDVLFWPLLISAGSALVITGIFSLLTLSISKASLICSIISVVFFTYGTITNLIEGVYFKFGSVEIGANKIIFSAEILLIAAVLLIVNRSRFNFQKLTAFLLVSSTVSVLLPLYPVAVQQLEQNRDKGNIPGKMSQKSVNGKKPDIYYIILDSFARKDIFQDHYGSTDTVLIPFLKENGFFIAERATSNYCRTVLSLASSLNYDYLDKLTKITGTHSNDIRPLKNLIWNNRLFSFMDKMGYTTVSFATGYWPTNIKSADLWLSSRWSMDDFSNGVLSLTPIPAFLQKIQSDQYDLQRKTILYTFDQLSRLPNHSGHPFFVFAHILAPHPPFVFNSDGSKPVQNGPFSLLEKGSTIDEHRTLYKEQYLFICRRTRDMVKSILENSPEPPVIIIQSDHGPGLKLSVEEIDKTDVPDIMSILNAIYTPEQCTTWAEMSPVNTFRVILNSLFHTDLELLEHKSYFSKWSTPYRFIDVTEEVSKGRSESNLFTE